MHALLLVAVTTAGCKGRQTTDDTAALWQETCARCHTRKELAGRTADEIQTALKEIPPMRALRVRLKPVQIQALARLLAGKETASAGLPPYRYQLSDMCRPCHPNQVAQWSGSMHARAHEEVVYERYFIKASQETGQKIETFCARCHTPLGVRFGEIPFHSAPRGPGGTRVSKVATEGVQCDFCHTISGYDALKNGGYRLTAVRVMRGPLRGARSPFHGTEFSPLHRQAELCGTCHDVSHPDCGVELETTYSEWRASPYARQGVVCQDCHMTRGLTHRLAQPGRAGHGGPPREHISDHGFIGPNILFATNDSEPVRRLKRLSLQLMQQAARLYIETPRRETVGLVLPIRVSNVGAGHGLPTGVTELRQMWLEVTVTDGGGRTVLRSGGLDAKGDLLPGTILYHTDVFDREGKVTTRFWNTVRKGRDHRIPPLQSVVEQVVVPGAPRGPLKVEVLLRYRSVSPAGLAEVNAPRDLVPIPVITMTRATATL